MTATSSAWGSQTAEGSTAFDWLHDESFRAEASRVVPLFRPLVEPLALTSGRNAEALLHDFSRLPNSIVAISGTLSGRQVGGPCTDLLLRDLANDAAPPHRVGYRSTMPNGRVCRSTSIYLFGAPQRPVGALCVNVDVGSLVAARNVLESLIGFDPPPSPPADGSPRPETFYRTVEEAADGILRDAIRNAPAPLDVMSRHHKVLLVHELESRGFFMLRGAAELAATALSVSKYTIYNYLNEVGKAGDTG